MGQKVLQVQFWTISQTNIHIISKHQENNDFMFFVLSSEHIDNQTATFQLQSGNQMKFQLDAGADCNVVPLYSYKPATQDRFLKNVQDELTLWLTVATKYQWLEHLFQQSPDGTKLSSWIVHVKSSITRAFDQSFADEPVLDSI